MRQIAEANGGRLLSREFINGVTPLRVRCNDGHEWNARPVDIKRNFSCPYCYLKHYAELKGGHILSTAYYGSTVKHTFRCKNGHEWETTPSSIKNSQTWCPVCCGNVPLNPLEELNRIAASKGGKCLSTVYVSRKKKLLFQCIDGHEWNASPGDILSKRWCPECVNKTESLVRQFFLCVFGAPFPSKSPPWLRLPGIPSRVLDGYNESLAIAFEYDGIQHREHVKFFHERSTKRTLSAQQNRDSFVRDACAKNNVMLINIPDLADGYSVSDFVVHVSKAITESTGRPVPDGVIQKFLHMPAGVSKLKEIQDIANTKGGLCLEQKYVSNISKMRFRCNEGHEFSAIPKTIRMGHWCPICTRYKLVDGLGELQTIAHLKGGECLSTEYVSSFKKMRFKCANGHEWDAMAYTIRQGTWCAVCAGRKIENPLGTVQRIAQSKGGKCLSTAYVNAKTRLQFRCGKGHEWDTTYGMIKRGTWCPYCYGNALSSPLVDIYRIAKEKGGECLSTTYVNSATKLHFRCGKGHEWHATYSMIKKRGTWCPYCSNVKQENPLGEFQQIAISKGGHCVSPVYVNCTTKLKFQCNKGHEFELRPADVKHAGSWCKICNQEVRKAMVKRRRYLEPNAASREALSELEAGTGQQFADVDELMADLQADD